LDKIKRLLFSYSRPKNDQEEYDDDFEDAIQDEFEQTSLKEADDTYLMYIIPL
jgi:hypothetical protein